MAKAIKAAAKRGAANTPARSRPCHTEAWLYCTDALRRLRGSFDTADPFDGRLSQAIDACFESEADGLELSLDR